MKAGQGATAQQLADLLEITPRRVQQLAKEGVFPKLDRGRYPLVECVRAFVKYWKDRADGRFADNELDAARLQREHLDIRKRAVEVAKAEGSVVAAEDHDEVIWKLLASIRSVVLALPGSWGSRVVGIETPVEGLLLMTKLADEIVEGVASCAEIFEIIDDSADPKPIPDDFPSAKHLRAAGIDTMEQLQALEDLTTVKGIGDRRAEEIEQAVAA